MAKQLTEEELALIARSDEEIAAEQHVFRFDMARCAERLRTGEPWQQLIQAHLYLDHTIGELLADAMPAPNAVELGRMGFHQKLQLVEGFALLPAALIPAVRKANSLRNKIAHDLNFELSQEDQASLIGLMAKEHQEAARDYKRDDTPELLFFANVLVVLVLQCEIVRQAHQSQRALLKKQELRLQNALYEAEKIHGPLT